jgi:hypothetical protein
MLNTIIQLLKTDNFYAQSEIVDIAKGKYKLTTSFKESIKQAIRWQKRK